MIMRDNDLSPVLLNKEEDMMKEAKPFVIDYVYAQSVECEEPCEGRLSRTVLWEGEGETPSLYSTLSYFVIIWYLSENRVKKCKMLIIYIFSGMFCL